MAGSCRKHSRSSPSFGEGPKSSLAEGCPATWYSSDVSGSMKVTHQGEPGGLCVGDWVGLSSSGKALQHLGLHPRDFLLSWSWLWEQKWMSSLVLVVDLLSLSIHSSNAAAATRVHWWASLALVSSHCLKCPVFLSRRLCPNGRMDKCWWVPVLCFLLAAHLSSTLGGL